MSVSSQSKELQRHELYVGIFRNRSWTSESLCDYFHQLIEGSCISECRFYPCASEGYDDYSFAILTFTSISSVDQCLSKNDEIKQKHHLIVKRNLRDSVREQRSACKYLLIHLNKFDPLFNKKNVLDYFGHYGLIIQWQILNNGRTFLLTFKDYDSVDRIFLDKPHFVNERILLIQKCFNPYTVTSFHPNDDRLKEKIRNLKASIERSKYLHESELLKLKKQIQEEIILQENQLSDIIKSNIHLQRMQRDLRRDLNDLHQINQQLKNQLQETMQKNQTIVNDFQNQFEQQRSINKSLKESILNLVQIQ